MGPDRATVAFVGTAQSPRQMRIVDATGATVETLGLADTRDLKDAWARPFHYALTVDGYLLSGLDDRGKEDPTTVIERVVPSAQ